MSKKKLDRKAYKEACKNFLIKLARQEGVNELPSRVLYEVVASGEGDKHPTTSNVVAVHYRGTLIDGREFDSTIGNPYPETLLLREAIEGWQIALTQMVVGDKWRIYLPYNVGYQDKGVDNIPPYSTLIFEVELIAIY